MSSEPFRIYNYTYTTDSEGRILTCKMVTIGGPQTDEDSVTNYTFTWEER